MKTDPWSSYWQGAAASLGDLDPETSAALDSGWTQLARTLPKGGQVLDLATGGALVLRRMQAVRRDLKLTGVDSASGLPRLPGLKLIERTRLEALPFPDERFDAVTSRFGIEYADVSAAASEAARVLRKGGVLLFLLHHRDGAIVRHNRARLAALKWAWRELALTDKARAVVQGRKIAMLPTPPAFAAAASEARRVHSSQPVAWEFATAVTETLNRGLGRPPSEALEVLETLDRRAAEEAGRLEALLSAACGAEGVERVSGPLRGANVQLAAAAEIIKHPRSGEALAWRLAGRK